MKNNFVNSQEGLPPSDFDDMLTPDTDKLDSPPLALNIRGVNTAGGKTNNAYTLKTLRVGRKDYKKAGDGLRGKNVTEAFRVKDKDMKRTMKWESPGIPSCLLRRGSRDNGSADLSRTADRNSAAATTSSGRNSTSTSKRKEKHNRHRSEPSCLKRQASSDMSVADEFLELMDKEHRRHGGL